MTSPLCALRTSLYPFLLRFVHRVLIVDGRDDDAEMIRRTLSRGGFAPACERVDTPEMLSWALQGPERWDEVLSAAVTARLDLRCALSLVHGIRPAVPCVISRGESEARWRSS